MCAQSASFRCPCKCAYYCSEACQHQVWKAHKTEHKAALKLVKPMVVVKSEKRGTGQGAAGRSAERAPVQKGKEEVQSAAVRVAGALLSIQDNM